jgi:hypothetical protein
LFYLDAAQRAADEELLRALDRRAGGLRFLASLLFFSSFPLRRRVDLLLAIMLIERDETRRDETRRDETRRDETRRDETRRDETNIGRT